MNRMTFNPVGLLFVLALCGGAYLIWGQHVAAWCFVGWCGWSFIVGTIDMMAKR